MKEEMFGLLAREWSMRAGRAAVSQLGPRSTSLRAFLDRQLIAPIGSPGGYMSHPVLETLFDWESHPFPLENVGCFEPSLIDALDRPPEELKEHRFDRTWHPHRHQFECWQHLMDDDPRSVIVSSGTASGKTECFLLPIMNSLAKELAESPDGGRLEGVRALFLYPLNALINSQRDRLSAWTSGFGDRMRFSLYNGATPEHGRSGNEYPRSYEVLSREQLRDSPPPMMLTNATMLEYMLIRGRDSDILSKSAGKLKWIVLDEAHTLVGSQAAEIALLLRRVMSAFAVDPQSVRFVATSATMGEDNDEALARFLADLAGVPVEQVSVVHGRRVVPPLPPKLTDTDQARPSLDSLASLSPADRFDALGSNAAFRSVRDALGSQHRRLDELVRTLQQLDGSSAPMRSEELLRLLDLAATARRTRGDVGGGKYLLPLRAHFFHRAQSGLWTCWSPLCKGKEEQGLEHEGDWRFGKIFLNRRSVCDACDSLVFELRFCMGCGTQHLEAINVGSSIRPTDMDTAELDSIQDTSDITGSEEEVEAEAEDEGDDSGFSTRELIFGGESVFRAEVQHTRSQPCLVNPRTGDVDDLGDSPIEIELASRTGSGYLRCEACRSSEAQPGRGFRSFKLGAPFFLGVAVPTLLEQLPIVEREGVSSLELPSQGKSMITFSDNRQGTAAFAARSQMDSDRNWARSFVYHKLWSGATEPDPAEVVGLEKIIETMRGVAGLESARVEYEAKLKKLRDPASSLELSWMELEEALLGEQTVQKWMVQAQKNRYTGVEVTGADIASLCLYREFWMRPRRYNSLETLGLAQLRYPKIEAIQTTPQSWKKLDASLEEWHEFLYLCVDYHTRDRSCARITDHLFRWTGTPGWPQIMVPPGTPAVKGRSVAWPEIKSTGRVGRIPMAIMAGFALDRDSVEEQTRVNSILQDAWASLIRVGLFEQTEHGYRLDLRAESRIVPLLHGWMCPLTRRVLGRTFRGFSPYLTSEMEYDVARCSAIDLPSMPFAFRRRRGLEVSLETIREWLRDDESITELRRLGAWTDFSDRIAMKVEYFNSVEHSAQQKEHLRQTYEKRFRKGEINLMCCSTTMEMGVDIGGLTAVAMNNAPPGPANFMQRAGRAGRRGQPQAVSLTFCQSTPHGMAVFENPEWPFVTPIHVPKVSLGSQRIVQRHINAAYFARFIKSHVASTGVMKLSCEDVFEGVAGEDSMGSKFVAWLKSSARNDEGLGRTSKNIISRTCLENVPFGQLCKDSAADFDAVIATWETDSGPLRQELQDLREAEGVDEGKGSPTVKAIAFQYRRLLEEYALKYLATKGFLPLYGFPIGVVPFVTTTSEEKYSAKTNVRSREDSQSRFRSYPSRPIPIAIREYAPGSAIVLNGVVYESGGVLLNWKIPATDSQVQEIQSIRWAWDCTGCGRAGVSHQLPEECEECNAEVRRERILQPGGFAVAASFRPHSDLTKRKFIAPADPTISIATEWNDLDDPEQGRWRTDPNGIVIHRSAGEGRFGYAVCLTCGRAASENMDQREGPAPRIMANHRRLRGSHKGDADNCCPGNASGFSILRNITFGGDEQTDVLEVEMKYRDGRSVKDETAAFSIGVALRQALCEGIGIDMREVGVAVKSIAKEDEETYEHHTVLFDAAAGGAGYVGLFGSDTASYLQRAFEILSCSKGCDSACHGCLLSFDTQHKTDVLDRFAALAVFNGYLLP